MVNKKFAKLWWQRGKRIGKNIKITKFEYYQKIIDGEHISIQFYSEDKKDENTLNM